MAKVYVLLKEGFEEIEALTIVDYLRRAEIDVYLVSVEDQLEVMGAHRIRVKADMGFEDLDEKEIDLLFLPGGLPGATSLRDDKKVIDLIKNLDARGKGLAAICAAPIVLERAGLTKDRKVTSYPGFEEEIGSDKYEEGLVVVDENIISSRGPATAVYLALELIGLLKGDRKKEEIRKDILLDLVEKDKC